MLRNIYNDAHLISYVNIIFFSIKLIKFKFFEKGIFYPAFTSNRIYAALLN